VGRALCLIDQALVASSAYRVVPTLRVRSWQIVLQKSFYLTGHKFSGP
jgi:hypothetical protein